MDCDGLRWDRGQGNNLDLVVDLDDLDSLAGSDSLDLVDLDSLGLDSLVDLGSLDLTDLDLGSSDLRQGTVQTEHLDHSVHLVHSGRLALVEVEDTHGRFRCHRYFLMMVVAQMVFVLQFHVMLHHNHRLK